MRTRNDGTIRRAGWTWLAAAMALVSVANAQTPGLAPTNAKVEISTISPKDPHPTTYSWDGKLESITQPKAYYTFYYTGTVQPDARVPDDAAIGRVPVKLSDWADNKRWIIAQLTTFYQQANNLPITALTEYQAGPVAPSLMMPGAPAPQQQTQPTAPQPQMGTMPPPQGFQQPGTSPQFGGPSQQPQQQAPPRGQGRTDEPAEAQGGMEPAENPEVQGEQGGGGGGGTTNVVNMPGTPPQPINISAFDPKSAAEWTFYYDQLVLWQYYCARNLLRGQDQTLLETLPPRGNPQQQQQLINQISGMTPQMLRSTTIKQSQQMSQQGQGMNQFRTSYMGGGGGMEGGNEPVEMGGGGGMMMMSGGGGFGGGPQGQQQQATMLRENFDPQKDFDSQASGTKSTGDEYRDKFLEAAKQLDEQIYTIYMEMLKGIDKRQASNESYEKWIKDKRQEVTNYAETWRKLEHGETIMIDGTMFLVSKDPLESVPNQTINVIKRERLTPADLLNADGTVRSADTK